MRRHLSALILVLALAPAHLVLAGPEIFSIDPDIGPAGTAITIKGKGLKGTEHVAFAVGRTVKPARFKVVSDEELQVTAPEYYRPQAAATVAVFTRSGATVAMPATAQEVRGSVPGFTRDPGAGFFHVLDGGIVARAGSVALIERGGVVERGGMPAMHFVRRGGTLVDYESPYGVVFHEPGAIFGPEFRRRPGLTFITVPTISGSPGVGPFTYQRAPHPDPEDFPAAPPQIRSFEPRAAAAGDIITLHGRGFARVTSVLSVEPNGAPLQAGFRVVSDDVLKVELPEEIRNPGPQVLIALGTEGLTVTVPKDRMFRAVAHPFLPPNNQPFAWVLKGDIAEKTGFVNVFVEDGGLSNDAANLMFVKKGGRVAGEGRGLWHRLFYEPGAIVPEELKARGVGEVPLIVPSYLPHPFVVLPGPVFRR